MTYRTFAETPALNNLLFERCQRSPIYPTRYQIGERRSVPN